MKSGILKPGMIHHNSQPSGLVNELQFYIFIKSFIVQLCGAREMCMQVRKQQLELDMEQQTGSKREKKYVKAVYCHPPYLTYMQSTS